MNWKVVGGILGAALIFWGGYKYAAALYEARISAINEAHAMALAQKESEYRANASKQILAYNEAIDELEKSRSDARSMRDSLERVRLEADRYRAELSRTGTASCKHFSERLAGCVKLLEEGASLSAEGAELSIDIARKKDAAVKIHLSGGKSGGT